MSWWCCAPLRGLLPPPPYPFHQTLNDVSARQPPRETASAAPPRPPDPGLASNSHTCSSNSSDTPLLRLRLHPRPRPRAGGFAAGTWNTATKSTRSHGRRRNCCCCCCLFRHRRRYRRAWGWVPCGSRAGAPCSGPSGKKGCGHRHHAPHRLLLLRWWCTRRLLTGHIFGSRRKNCRWCFGGRAAGVDRGRRGAGRASVCNLCRDTSTRRVCRWIVVVVVARSFSRPGVSDSHTQSGTGCRAIIYFLTCLVVVVVA